VGKLVVPFHGKLHIPDTILRMVKTRAVDTTVATVTHATIMAIQTELAIDTIVTRVTIVTVHAISTTSTVTYTDTTGI
jgi:hypothetical protein